VWVDGDEVVHVACSGCKACHFRAEASTQDDGWLGRVIGCGMHIGEETVAFPHAAPLDRYEVADLDLPEVGSSC
jgi:hypothetical protein